MGRSYTPTYRVEYQTDTARWQTMCWDTASHGRPNTASLEKWRRSYNESFAPGGDNEHVSKDLGVVIHISRAKLVHQRTGRVMCEVTMPLFEVI